MGTLHITNKNAELSFETNHNLLVISKTKYRHDHLKMALLLPDDTNLDPGPVNEYHIRDHEFDKICQQETAFFSP